ncbi:hypothetical protein NDU88_003271 [Pleurodeles waltl]|uniref:Uncharacterized protein n=1 Tax=Pleurodeles waltl TaxID=8319 RepID=A0AAV7Q8I3_PLEWA|nr:hypothetical protein NDU88_003271 [Pleurodeles waltl]
MAVTSAAVRTVTADVHRHWLLGPIGHRPLGHVRRWRHPPVYRPLVGLSTMEERHEDGPDGGVVAAVELVDGEDEEAEEEDMNNRDSVI